MGNSNVTWCLECHSYKDSATHASLWLNTIVRLLTSQLVSPHRDDDYDDGDDDDDDGDGDDDYSGRQQHACANSSDISLASAKGCFFASHDLQSVQLGGS